MLETVDEVARRLQIEAHERGVAAEVAELVVVDVAEVESRDERGAEALPEVLVLRPLEKALVQKAHVHHVDVHRPQRKGGVAGVAPHVGEAEAREGAPVEGPVLEVDRELRLRPGLVHRTVTLRTEGHEEARERERYRGAELVGHAFARIGRLHEFVTSRHGDVERLGTAEDIAVLIADGRLQAVEARRGRPLELHLEALA